MATVQTSIRKQKGAQTSVQRPSKAHLEAPSHESALQASRREVLIRQPSYCKILDDLERTEETTEIRMKSERQDVDEVSTSTSAHKVQTITINGQQYQILSPEADALQALAGVNASSRDVVQYIPASPPGHTAYTGKVSSSPGGASVSVRGANSTSGSSPTGSMPRSTEDAARKREIRLLKNREAARECRNKKKEYIKCLENRVAVLENQNKALIEELKSLKELYTGQKS